MACELQPPQFCKFFLVERFEIVLFILPADGDVKLRIREKITELWRGFTSGPAGDGRFFDGQIVVKRFYRWKQSIVRSRRMKFGWKKSRSSWAPCCWLGQVCPNGHYFKHQVDVTTNEPLDSLDFFVTPPKLDIR